MASAGVKYERSGTEPVVLVVEDDPDIRDILVEILRDEGYEVASRGHGGEALSFLREGRRPALVLLDFMMPVVDGQQFLAEQASDPALRDLCVVVMSADNRACDRVPGDIAGLLRKPVTVDALLELVARYCPRTRRRSRAPSLPSAGA